MEEALPIPSGIPVHRPIGQTLPAGETTPVFGPSRLIDFELETALLRLTLM
jgi:fumarylacetoacetase